MNAIAKDTDGSLIDPFNGQRDIRVRIIRAVGDPFDRLTEDALRAVRALRFSVTKGFTIDKDLAFAMESAAVLNAIVDNISDERVQIELSKMFRFDTVSSLIRINEFPALRDAMFAGNVSLDATMKLKGRSK
jgi:tRNA nucleotidyltransferase (CCA-adding enzyme)